MKSFNLNNVACGKLEFFALVANPKAPGIFSLSVGDTLNVKVAPVRGLHETAMLFKEDLVVGAVGGVLASKLNSCLSKGVAFKAVVQSIVGGVVCVRVSPAPAE